ncbi:ankyrin repeat-containing domain protein [Xylaria curta]|nr:ankyrin repeat-containing domain protein [Xylaria curta]
MKNLVSPVRIRSYRTRNSVDAQSLTKCTIWQAARATSAAATFFDPIRIGNQKFVDGAFGRNNPVNDVLDEAKSIWPDAVQNARIECLVSVGTGLLDLRNLGNNVAQLVITLKDIVTETENTHERFFRNHEDLGVGNRYFRFNVIQGLSNVRLDESERLDTIEAAAERYLDTHAVEELVEKLRSSRAPMNRLLSQEEKDRYLNWLRPRYPSRLLNNARGNRKVESRWFIEGPLESWMHKESSALWLVGKPGAGKTILSSSAVDVLQKDPKVNVLYYYFSFGDNETQSIEDFKKALLAQLVQFLTHEDKDKGGFWHVPVAFQRLFGDYQLSEDLALERFEETFWELLKESPKNYIVVDALDECSSLDNRVSVLNYLNRFRKYPHGNNCIMITSRWLDIVAKELQPEIRVIMESENVKQDIKSYLDHELESAKYSWWKDELRAQVKQRLIEKAGGVFRWVALQLINLQSCQRPVEVEEALAELPEGLEETYKVMLNRIHNRHYQPVISVVKWLAYSKRPLLLSEVAEIAVFRYEQDTEHESTTFDPRERFPSIHEIRSILAGLIMVTSVDGGSEIEDDDGRVSFSHFTVQEYLEGPNTSPHAFHLDKIDAHRFILRSSLSYIHYYEHISTQVFDLEANELEANTLDLDSSSTTQSNSQRNFNGHGDYADYRPFPLLLYAVKYWWRHCLEFRPIDGERSKATYGLDNHIGPVLRISIETGLSKGGSDRVDYSSQLESLCISSIQSFEKYKPRPNFKFDWDTMYPLHEGAKTNDWKIIQILLDVGIAIDAKNGSSLTPLASAARHGCTEVVTYLVKKGAGIDISDDNGTASDRAKFMSVNAMLYCTRLVSLANFCVAQARHKNQGWTPLHWTIERGHVDTAIRLIELGANLVRGSWWSLTPLGLAIIKGQESIVEAMIQRSSEACIAWRGDESVSNGWGAIHLAAVYRNAVIIKMLLKAGAQVKERDSNGLSPLDLAAIGVPAYILEAFDNKFDAERYTKYMAQHGVCGNSSSAIIALIDGGAAMEGGPSLQSPLHWAATKGQLESTKLLLDYKAELEAKNIDGLTPLGAAALGGHGTVVQVLISRGAHVDAIDKKNMSPLLIATLFGHREVLKQLLRAGADTSIRESKNGKTALDIARDAGNNDFAQLITDLGVEREGALVGTQT